MPSFSRTGVFYRQFHAIFRVVSLSILLALGFAGCGYHQVGRGTVVTSGVQTLAVPLFTSRVQAFATETVFTQAVVRELNTSTRFRVLTATSAGEGETANADATLHGTILKQTVTPLTYDASSGQTSSYLVTISAKVTLLGNGGRVLYSNDAFAWREQYQSTQDLSGSLQEDTPAVRRLAHDFAQSLVSEIMEALR